MSYSDIAFNWRATMGNATALAADVTEYLDLLAGLAQDDGFYPGYTAHRHTCAIDDPLVLLDHARRQDLRSTIADFRLFDKAVADVRAHRKPFFCDAEIERRMKEADGNCPMCGFGVVWHSGEDPQGYRSQMTHCQHNLGHRVKPDDVEAYLHRPSSWQGSTWPYGYMSGNKLTDKTGKTYLHADDVTGKTPCIGCLEMEAEERMERALTALVSGVEPGQFNKSGWSSPVSEYVGSGDHAEDMAYMRVKQVFTGARRSFSDSRELRLNGAGLKLYVKPARHSGYGRQVSFGMRVGGDQVGDYPGFQAYAHALFEEHGVPTQTA